MGGEGERGTHREKETEEASSILISTHPLTHPKYPTSFTPFSNVLSSIHYLVTSQPEQHNHDIGKVRKLYSTAQYGSEVNKSDSHYSALIVLLIPHNPSFSILLILFYTSLSSSPVYQYPLLQLHIHSSSTLPSWLLLLLLIHTYPAT